MRRPIDTHIDPERCIGCGDCTDVCPSDAIAVIDGVATVTGEESLGCDHCVAACPEEAIRIGFVDDDALTLATVKSADGYVAPGDYDLSGLVRLMRSRRSCRNFRATPVSMETLEDLVKIGITAPSGTNSQLWTFTLVPDRPSVLELAEAVRAFYRRLNRMAEKRWLRGLARVFMKDALGKYYRLYYQRIQEGLEESERGGRERLFHGAPAAILVGAAPGASCPAEDALLATQNILLGAHAMGLGTCLVGFVVEALRRDPSIKRRLKIPAEEHIYAVIAVGYPNESYRRTCRRRRIVPRVFRV